MQKKNKTTWKRLLFGERLAEKKESHKIAYIAVTTALIVVANTFLEFKLAETQFSLTLAISVLTGILIGPIFGFCACFLGDLVGFLYNSAGFAYMPWIGISMGLTALIAGFITGGFSKTGGTFIKLALVCILTFCICTVGINTTAFWILYSKGKVPYGTYLISRLFLQGQIWNSLFNYALLFLAVPLLKKSKIL